MLNASGSAICAEIHAGVGQLLRLLELTGHGRDERVDDTHDPAHPRLGVPSDHIVDGGERSLRAGCVTQAHRSVEGAEVDHETQMRIAAGIRCGDRAADDVGPYLSGGGGPQCAEDLGGQAGDEQRVVGCISKGQGLESGALPTSLVARRHQGSSQQSEKTRPHADILQTECSPVASMTHPNDTIEDKAGTIGSPMPGVEVKIVDPETGATLPIGEVGEYCTRGYHVMHNYFENPDATARTIDADGWLHTGDLCAMDERGYCTVEGRLKDMIIRGGENIYPRELEDLLFAHPSVGEVAVVGLPDDRMGEVVAAFVRPAPGYTIRKDELFAYMRQHLAPHKTPKHWVALDAFPLTASGKIQKYKLRDQWAAHEFAEL